MPELPEVETIVRDLRPLLTGRQRSPGCGRASRSCAGRGRPHERFRDRGEGRRACAAAASGSSSISIPHLNGSAGDHAILSVHLGMTGQFTVVKTDEPEPDHLHLVFALDNETELRFRDPRRFGFGRL